MICYTVWYSIAMISGWYITMAVTSMIWYHYMVCATPVRQDISIVWFDVMSVCIMSLQQGISIWTQHGVISVWYDVISVTHGIWINYVSHHDIEDNKWCDMYHQKGTPITSCWHGIILICHISYPIPSHHRISSHHITQHYTSHHIIPFHLIMRSYHPIPSSHHIIASHPTTSHITSHHPIPSHNEIIPSHPIPSSHHIIASHPTTSHSITHHITSSHPIS